MKKYIIPILYTIIIIVVGSLLSSVLYYFNITSDKLNTIFLYAVSILAIFIGSINMSKELKFKGIINGIIYFLGWFILMLFMSFIVFKSDINIKNIIYYIIILIFSILGGIIGKNLKENTDD